MLLNLDVFGYNRFEDRGTIDLAYSEIVKILGVPRNSQWLFELDNEYCILSGNTDKTPIEQVTTWTVSGNPASLELVNQLFLEYEPFGYAHEE